MRKNIAIITGASSGMGKEFVKQLPNHMLHLDELWLIARTTEKLEDLRQEILEENMECVLALLSLDLCKKEDLLTFRTRLEESNPNVKMLINTAGVGYAGSFDTLSLEEVCDMTHLNVESLTAVTHLVLPFMTKGSHIIELASASAFMPQKEFSVYAASKAYVLSFARALRKELKCKGINVTIVCPGPVDTPFLAKSNKGKAQKPLKKFVTVQAEHVVKKALLDTFKRKALSIYGLPMKVVYVVSIIRPVL